jgi:hypothetical protein
MLMAMAVDKEAALTPGKESHAMESFAYALRQLPAIIAENGGFDAAQLVSELRALHAQGKHTVGLGKSGSFSRLGLSSIQDLSRKSLIIINCHNGGSCTVILLVNTMLLLFYDDSLGAILFNYQPTKFWVTWGSFPVVNYRYVKYIYFWT